MLLHILIEIVRSIEGIIFIFDKTATLNFVVICVVSMLVNDS